MFFLLHSVGRRDLSAGPEQKKNTTQGVFFCCGPGERQGKEKPRWKPARGQSKKKKHHPGCFFFLLRPRRKAREGEAPLEAGTGPEQKKNTNQGVFFCSGPGERQGKEKPRWAPARGQSKKSFFYFALAPCRRPTGLLLPLPFAGAAAKKKKNLGGVFFLLWPRAGFQRGFSFPCLSPGPQQKKNTLGGVFFFALAPCRLPTGLLLPLPFAGAAAKKKNTLGGAFFFAAAPRGRSLTHCGPGWRCLPLAGAVFFFSLRPRPDRGGVFFCCGPARTVTHSRWAGAISARPGWCFFFLLRPRRVFLDNSKKCLGYYIGSKKTRRGHSKKKTPLPT